MKHLRLFLAAALLAFVAGCAQPTVKPQSPEDIVQDARVQVGAIYRTIGDLKASGQITQAQAKAAIAKVEPYETQANLAASLLKSGQPDQSLSVARGALLGLTEIKAALPAPKGK